MIVLVCSMITAQEAKANALKDAEKHMDYYVNQAIPLIRSIREKFKGKKGKTVDSRIPVRLLKELRRALIEDIDVSYEFFCSSNDVSVTFHVESLYSVEGMDRLQHVILRKCLPALSLDRNGNIE